jgi:hypothetical protein
LDYRITARLLDYSWITELQENTAGFQDYCLDYRIPAILLDYNTITGLKLDSWISVVITGFQLEFIISVIQL